MSKERMSPPPMKHGKPGPGGPPGGPHGRPVEKAKDFKGTVKKLLKLVTPFRFKLLLIVFLAACSSLFAVIGPKILAQATPQGVAVLWGRNSEIQARYPLLVEILGR